MLEQAARTLKPTTPEEVQAAIAEAGATARHIEVMGSGTKRTMGGMDRVDVVLSTQRLDRIVDYSPEELTLTAQPGVRIADLERICAARGQMLAFEPPRFNGKGTVGGMVSAGLSGPTRAALGSVRDHLLGAVLINGQGELLGFGGTVMKNVAGFDVSRVLAGAMGQLGLITEVTLKVLPLPAATATLRFDFDQGAALMALNRWGGEPLPIEASAWCRLCAAPITTPYTARNTKLDRNIARILGSTSICWRISVKNLRRLRKIVSMMERCSIGSDSCEVAILNP